MPYIKIYLKDLAEFVFIYRKILPKNLDDIEYLRCNFVVRRYKTSKKIIHIADLYEKNNQILAYRRPFSDYLKLSMSKGPHNKVFILLQIRYENSQIRVGTLVSHKNNTIFNFKNYPK